MKEINSIKEKRARIVLSKEIARRRNDFNSLVKNNIIKSDDGWDSDTWTYKSFNIYFNKWHGKNGKVISNHCKYENRIFLKDASTDIAKCYIIVQIKKMLSGPYVRGCAAIVGVLSEVLGDSLCDWIVINKSSLSGAVNNLKRNYQSQYTLYERVNKLLQFYEYIKTIRHPVQDKEVSFLVNTFLWHHGINNPVNGNNIDNSKNTKRLKYHDEIGSAIGKLKEIVTNINEPKEGYYRIRIEALAFVLAHGLRIGELLRLPNHPLGKEDGMLFTRVYTEKGQPPIIRAVSPVWEEAIINAEKYLVRVCEPARKRAREIEEDGFKFLYNEINKFREINTQNETHIQQIEVMGFDVNNTSFVKEFSDCFNTTKKRFFNKNNPFRAATRLVAQPLPAKATVWLDERFELWDWNKYVYQPGAYVNHNLIGLFSPKGIAKLCGGSKGSASKEPYYSCIREVIELLKKESVIGNTDEQHIRNISEIKKNNIRNKWKKIRKEIIRTSKGCNRVILLDELSLVLKKKYNEWLEKHYSQIRNDSIDDSVQVKQEISSKSFRKNLPLSEHLLVVWEKQFSDSTKDFSLGLIPKPVFRKDFYDFLGADNTKTSIFQKFNINSDNGKPYVIRPHEIRHWLTTSMMRSGINEQVIDLWMGRTPGQSRHYDHRTSSERALNIREKLINTLTNKIPMNNLGKKILIWRKENVSLDKQRELLERKLKVMHFTPQGLCDRSLSINPCQKGMACLHGYGEQNGCKHFYIDPGDETARLEILKIKKENEKMLSLLMDGYSRIHNAFEKSMINNEYIIRNVSHIKSIIDGCSKALIVYDEARKNICEVSATQEGEKIIKVANVFGKME